MTITIGWWLAPFLVTLGAFAPLLIPDRGIFQSDPWGSMFYVAVALIVSMAAWLVYLALRVWLGIS